MAFNEGNKVVFAYVRGRQSEIIYDGEDRKQGFALGLVTVAGDFLKQVDVGIAVTKAEGESVGQEIDSIVRDNFPDLASFF